VAEQRGDVIDAALDDTGRAGRARDRIATRPSQIANSSLGDQSSRADQSDLRHVASRTAIATSRAERRLSEAHFDEAQVGGRFCVVDMSPTGVAPIMVRRRLPPLSQVAFEWDWSETDQAAADSS